MDISKIRLGEENYNIKDEVARSKIKKLELNNIIFIGDSYTGGYSPDEVIPENARFWKKFADLVGATQVRQFNAGGIGFYQKVDNINFLKLLQNNIDSITDKEDVDAICVFAGYNDAWENTTTKTILHNSIGDFIDYVNLNFPNAKILISQIGCNTNRTDEGSRIRQNLIDNVTKGYADNENLKYIYLDNCETVLRDKDLLASDGIHPTSYGHTIIATALFHSLTNTNSFNFIRSESFTPSPYFDDGNISGSIFSYNDGKLKYMRFNNLLFGFSENNRGNLNHNNGFIVGINNSKTVLPNYNIPINVNCHITDYNGNHYFVNGTLTFVNNYITLQINDIVNNNWLSISDVHYIEIMNTDIIEDVHYI